LADETKAYPVTTGDEISAMAEISVDFMVMVLLFMDVMCDVWFLIYERDGILVLERSDV